VKKIELRTWSIFLLAIYTAAIMIIELQTSQQFVRHFLTDIEGPVPFYAINTSLSVMLLFFTSLVFAVNILCMQSIRQNKLRFYFYVSQVIIFAYLGLDDRFMFHEKMKSNTGIEGDIVIILAAMVELFLLFKLGNIKNMNYRTKLYLILGAAFFGLMVMFDTLFPSEMVLRLSLEDLSKSWSAFFLFLFSWEILKENITSLKISKIVS
jgi:hypothetical protein